jgi:hypothetical protein
MGVLNKRLVFNKMVVLNYMKYLIYWKQAISNTSTRNNLLSGIN